MGLPYSVIKSDPVLLAKERERNRKKERLARANGKRPKPSTEKQLEYLKRERAKNPERYAAYKRVVVATRNGKLKRQPCEVCGSVETQAHHSDYSKALEVRWFCRDHHWAQHLNKMPETPIQ